MPNFIIPSKSSLLKISLALVVLAFIGAAGTFSYLGFVELQQLNDSITEDRERLVLLENAPTPTRSYPPTLSHPDYSAADRHPSTHLHPDNLATHGYPYQPAPVPHSRSHLERSVPANQALGSESGNHWGQRDRLGV